MKRIDDEMPAGVNVEYPTNRVLGVVDDSKAAEAIVSELAEMPFDEDSIDLLCNEVVAKKIAEYQEEHPWKAKINHIMTFMSNESELIDQYDQMLENGELIVSAEVEDEEQAEEVAAAMRAHGGHFINYFGTQVITTLEP